MHRGSPRRDCTPLPGGRRTARRNEWGLDRKGGQLCLRTSAVVERGDRGKGRGLPVEECNARGDGGERAVVDLSVGSFVRLLKDVATRGAMPVGVRRVTDIEAVSPIASAARQAHWKGRVEEGTVEPKALSTTH